MTHFTGTTGVKYMNTRRDGSVGGYRKLAERVHTWHSTAGSCRYEQRQSEKLGCWWLTGKVHDV